MAEIPIFSTLEDACHAVGVVPIKTQRRAGFIPANVGNSASGRGDARIKFFSDNAGGMVFNWKTGEQAFFFYDHGTGQQLTREELKARKAELNKLAQQEAKQTGERQKAVANLAAQIVGEAQHSNNHPYLCRKRVIGFLGVPSLEIDKAAAQDLINGVSIPFSEGAPQSLKHLESRLLVIPLIDEKSALWSLQFIDTKGQKAFLKGGRLSGLIWQPEGVPFDSHRTNPIALCEGVVTALSVRKLYGVPCAAAICAGNLLRAAQMMRSVFRNSELWICADRDENGTGEQKAREAAEGVTHSRLFICPELTPSEMESFYRLTGSRKATDYNDLMIARELGGGANSQCFSLRKESKNE